MQTQHIVILGAGQTGTRIAHKLSDKNRKITLVSLLHHREDYLQDLVVSVATPRAIAIMPPSTPPAESSLEPVVAESSPHFLDERRLRLNGQDISFDFAVLASGCGPRVPTEFSDDSWVTPIDFFKSGSATKDTQIVGAGPVGICAAMKIAQQTGGAQLIARSDRILAYEDEAIATFARKTLEAAGVRIVHTATPSTNPVVLCAGLKPNSDELNLRAPYIYAAPDGAVRTDALMRTACSRVYAAGAITGPPFDLAFERFQSDLVAENIQAPFFMKHRFMPEAWPFVIPFSIPLARVGMTEREACEKFRENDVVAVTQPIENGFVKIVARKRSGLLAGAHIAGTGAESLILFFDLLMRAEIPLRELADRHHFSATPLPEAAAEAIERWIELAGR